MLDICCIISLFDTSLYADMADISIFVRVEGQPNGLFQILLDLWEKEVLRSDANIIFDRSTTVSTK